MLNDPQGALADYNQAIALNPSDAEAYNSRGVLKYQILKDDRGALADFDRAIAVAHNYADAYQSRAILKYEQLNDRAGGIADLQEAARLAAVQGNTKDLNSVVNKLKSWGF
jgi:tetratricopeptide (TPR) repeat protein